MEGNLTRSPWIFVIVHRKWGDIALPSHFSHFFVSINEPLNILFRILWMSFQLFSSIFGASFVSLKVSNRLECATVTNWNAERDSNMWRIWEGCYVPVFPVVIEWGTVHYILIDTFHGQGQGSHHIYGREFLWVSIISKVSARIHSDRLGRGIGRSWSTMTGGKGLMGLPEPYTEGISKRDSVREKRNRSINLEPIGVLRDVFFSWTLSGGHGKKAGEVRPDELLSDNLKGWSTPRRKFDVFAQGAMLQTDFRKPDSILF